MARSASKRAWQRKFKADMLLIIREAKNRPCMDCQGVYPYYVMDFDHRPEEDKKYEMSKLHKNATSKARVEEEIAKCDVVCSNCHRIRTFERGQHLST